MVPTENRYGNIRPKTTFISETASVSKAIGRTLPDKYEPQLAKYINGKKLTTATINAVIDEIIFCGITKQSKLAIDKKKANGVTLMKNRITESLNK